MRPMQVLMVHPEMRLTAWLVPVLGFLDQMPLCLLQKKVDEMVDKGWKAKLVYFLVLHVQCGLHTRPRGPPRQCDSSESVLIDSCCMVSSASAGWSPGQPSMSFLAECFIPFQLLCCHWHRSRHDLEWCQWNDLLRSFQIIHV
jgi:hypothetical protein